VLRLPLLAVALVALPFAGKALAQEPINLKGGATFKTPVEFGFAITLKNKGEVVGVVTLPKGVQRTVSVQAREIEVNGEGQPIEFTIRTGRVTIGNQGQRGTTYKGNVALQITQGGKTIMELKADEATMVPLAE